jgi:trehalose-6-phosphatase
MKLCLPEKQVIDNSGMWVDGALARQEQRFRYEQVFQGDPTDAENVFVFATDDMTDEQVRDCVRKFV